MPMCVSGQTLKTRRDMAKTTSNPMENAESKSELPLVWRTRSSMLVDRRPYNDQNKDQTDQKVGQRKRGKKKKDDRVERTKDHQQRTKT